MNVVNYDVRSDRSCQIVVMGNLKAIGRRIATLRRAADMTQIDLAVAIGVSRSILGEIEGGTQPGGLNTMLAIADELKVPFDWLIGRKVPPGGPLVGKFVDDPDTLAWVGFWEGLAPEQRPVAAKMLGLPPAAAAA
jgi:transcriptional regulator with XRE-family HTH domain